MTTTLPNGLKVAYPAELPITERRQELLDTIAANQVVVVSGETGSGKSTQLPKFCLELGRGVDGLIGHTQPRRIAARSIADRVAEELGEDVGGTVGYTVRFTDKVSKATMVKLMTDGILLAEINRDPQLKRYDTIILDEAHERTLNIDFLLGYLRQLLPQRPDLKLIITSATIDTERFADHFDRAAIVEVSGRTFPVEMRYRPLDGAEGGTDGRDQPQGICDAVEELITEGDGDVLVFCSGEREIRDAVDALADTSLPDTEILPLYARLSSADQHRIFEPHQRRRVVVATNVAETSLTVPGVRYVVDPGTARISRYSRRTKVQRLPIEAISRASADQRAGRCGRVAPGICIRLYSQQDYDERPEFTEPEIQRTGLASVILQMAAIGLGDIDSFPFVDPPDRRNIRDGIALLEELEATAGTRQSQTGSVLKLTGLGRKLAKLPIDPRLGRMILAADENGCLREVLVIASGLSIQDPRDRPRDKRSQADEFHSRFDDPDSDFVGFLNLWKYLLDERRAGSSGKFRRMCRREFLNYPRVREWQDIHAQLRRTCKELGLRINASPAPVEVIHASLLVGLLSQVGTKDKDSFEYRGARNAKFAIAPGSTMFGSGPRWVMAAELVETTRLWAHVVTRTSPEDIERAAAHLVKRSYTDPRWDVEQGAAVANESVSLFGLPLVGGRSVMWGGIDPVDARDLFIHHALVGGEWESHHGFVSHNQLRIAEVHGLEARFRRADLMIDTNQLFDWFDERIPNNIVSVRHFDRWWDGTRNNDPDLLDLTVEDLLDHTMTPGSSDDFPDAWAYGDLALPLSYEFDPTRSNDGVTIDIPVSAIGHIDEDPFDWLVPGLRGELVATLIKNMPKALRKAFVPIPQTIETLLPRLQPGGANLIESLQTELARLGSVRVGVDALDLDRLPIHLRPNFRIINSEGQAIAVGGDLRALEALLDSEVRASLESSPHALERSGLTSWPLPELPRQVEISGTGHVVQAYPALIDEGDGVAIQLLATPNEQRHAMWAGTRRLLLLNRPGVSKPLRSLLTNEVKLALLQSPYGSPSEWFDDLMGCAVDQLMIEANAPVWTEGDWDTLLAFVQLELPDRVIGLGQMSAQILADLSAVEVELAAMPTPKFAAASADIRCQLDGLVYPGFLSAVGARNLPNVGRYLKAIARRLHQLPENPRRDLATMARIQALDQEHTRLAEILPWSDELEQVSWHLQELRVSLFAQSLGTKGQVSEKRIRRALEHLAGNR